jgi:hypothetical protein
VEIDLVDLVDRDRPGTLTRICEGVGVAADPTMVRWFEENVTSSGAHQGRWRADFAPAVCSEIDDRYAAVCERLDEQGVRIPPPGS